MWIVDQAEASLMIGDRGKSLRAPNPQTYWYRTSVAPFSQAVLLWAFALLLRRIQEPAPAPIEQAIDTFALKEPGMTVV